MKLFIFVFLLAFVLYEVDATCNRLSYINRIQNCQNISNCKKCNDCAWSAWSSCQKNKDCSQSVKNECTTTINTVVKNPRCKNSCS